VINRMQLLKKSLEKNQLDGYMAADENNMFYLTGFEGAARLLVPADNGNLNVKDVRSTTVSDMSISLSLHQCH